MPRFDGTGPMGYGPMTGRGMGYCQGQPRPMRGFYGRGMRARGFYGYQRPYFYDDVYDQRPAKEMLMEQKEYLEKQLENITKRLEELE